MSTATRIRRLLILVDLCIQLNKVIHESQTYKWDNPSCGGHGISYTVYTGHGISYTVYTGHGISYTLEQTGALQKYIIFSTYVSAELHFQKMTGDSGTKAMS